MKVISESNMIHRTLEDSTTWISRILKYFNIIYKPTTTVTYFIHMDSGSVIQATVTARGYLDSTELENMKIAAKKQAYEILNRVGNTYYETPTK